VIRDLLKLAEDAIDLIPPSYSERGPLLDRLAELKICAADEDDGDTMSDEAVHVALSACSWGGDR
jgi:hypothetical protein